MKTKIFSLILILSVFLIIFGSINIKSVQATNWLTGWTYRKSHLITNSTGADINYQVNVTVINGSSADTGTFVYINNKTRADFGDVRFTDDTGNTLLYYWMELLYSGLNATFQVKVSGNLTSTNQTIYVYYGKTSATDSSDGTNTFLFFDDFNDNSINSTLWSTYGTVSETGGEAVSTTMNSGFKGKTTWQYNVTVIFNGKIGATGTNTFFGFDNYNGIASTGYTNYFRFLNGNIKHYTYDGVNLGSTDTGCTVGTYNIVEVTYLNGTSKCIVNNTVVSSRTQYIPTMALPVQIGSANLGVTSFNVTWCFVRKYLVTEPISSTWGNEETSAPTSYTFNGTITEILGISYKRMITFNPSGLVIEKFTTDGLVLKIVSFMGKIFFNISTMTTNYYWMLVSFAFDYSMLTVLLFLLASNIVLCIKRVPIISFVIGIFSFAIGVYEVNNTTIPANPLFSIMLCLVGIVSILINTLDMKK